ncbi:UDP-N-acetylenolpyruvoylglucosamine reductase [Candidatus Nomurabacteria bacterium RIFCSPLOWO2_01_FULL_42_17]|uniref:UDP-N-acetylenolpyruvoylglucosamine reductase n=1 Tax=Candidatus Nomurabacteria bacterium RIFCSPLOWO2_01_FULL_42_17 TaxID=1801780 RepID=A0A1F6XN06_9BACT|nr:MAG: UDP-N-acetylenolpyruvoylglucosamine reductase [Candidatus Nomurabacteria bacterium RIFCSPLOWO2_01_FULL_42_17]
MNIQQNYNLSKLNTFGISATAKFFVEIHTENDLREIFDASEFKNNKKLFLGGGSNVLFTKDFDGLVILNKLKGIEILKAPTPQRVGVPTESVGKDFVYIRAMGGEIWHDLVTFAVGRGLWGIENLALIPGTVGAAPMQNIGAYGAELEQVLVNVEAFDVDTGKENKKRIFSKEECGFGYRESVFKNKLKDKYFITAITLKLSKIPKPNLSYKILAEYLEKPARNATPVRNDSRSDSGRHSVAGGNKIEIKNSKDISDAVSHIRRTKLPDPAVIPNAGSFFKNVFVSPTELKKLQETYPDMPYFDEPSDAPALAGKGGAVKIPAGWLIEQCGWKGKRLGNVGVHDKQALVLVNYGGAEGEEIKNLAQMIIADVKNKFDLKLIPEVNLI